MELPTNVFKRALRQGRPQIGLWVGLADAYVAELLATAGFDCLVIDAEHAPNDPRSVLPQLQAMAPYPVHPIVRPASASVESIKQYLDIGAQTLIIPMVETPEQARQMVAATRYPTRGVRGVGSALARASRWNQIDDYLRRSDEEMCVFVQVESINALTHLERIAAVDGVDGVFFGPADLAASMGLLGKPSDPAVRDPIPQGTAAGKKAGKAAGTLTSDRGFRRVHLQHVSTFTLRGVGPIPLVQATLVCVAGCRGGYL